MDTTLFPSCYLGPTSYYSLLLQSQQPVIEKWEHYTKQTYRNRCRIATANKVMDLTIPIERNGQKTVMRDVKIAYQQNWQQVHWNAIESAYRTSPYFEYFSDELIGFYEKEETYLLDFNLKLHEKVCELMQMHIPMAFTDQYEADINGKDLRELFTPKKGSTQCKPYHQVFENRFGFQTDLSIIDLVLNEGPEAYKYL
jgi:hypothetical protein